ncbi:hypothetical protein KSF78_0009531 [Schistosoma japonicum]|nr:hypothetical protein KSF78_0009531 [Schistosoma japonicum]KAH8857374.1 hypothetical protein KSF78_0009531 [Schistosoma japonicum]
MMLLLLVYINMSLMLIHESTQFKNSEADKMKLKRNTERIESALLSKLPVIQILERQITAEIGAMNNDLKKFNRSIDGYADCVRTNSISLRGINYAEVMLIIIKSEIVIGTDYYNSTLATSSKCLNKIKDKYQEDISKHGMDTCHQLANPNPHGLNKLRNLIVEYYDEIFSYNVWFDIKNVLKYIVN